jgi:hypothetical protein
LKELDLHGVSHYDVRDVVENFILMNDTPFRIITGYSERMRNLTQNTLNKHRLQYYIPAHNAGEIIVID